VIAADTNIFLYALNADAPEHVRARAFLEAHVGNPDFVLCELMLVELYVLLRNPSVLRHPLDAGAAVAVVQQFRHHPTWQLIDHDPEVMDDVWKAAEERQFARGRIYDARLALTLRRHGVTEFATRNVKHFEGFGFQSLWNPLS
jgi:toxin-antitoxin system PIN domain toxin